MSLYDDVTRARDLLSRQGYQPNPMPAEVELLLRDFRAMSDLLAEIRDLVNRWADRGDVTDQTSFLLADLLLCLHRGGWS